MIVSQELNDHQLTINLTMVKPWLTIARNGCQVDLCDTMMVRPWSTMIRAWLTMVYPEQTIWTWFDHGGLRFSIGMMVWNVVNHGQIVKVIFSQSWALLSF